MSDLYNTLITNWRRIYINSVLFVVLVFTILAIAYLYVSNERTFYFWDSGTYHTMTLEKSIYLRETPKNSIRDLARVLKEIWESTSKDYSDLHTLPVIPFVLTFGDSHLTYIIALSIVYLLPFALVTGALASKLLPTNNDYFFWFSSFLSVLVPATWLPILSGYPDTGSAIFIALAALVYLHDTELKNWRQVLLIGFFVAFAILFRRHFAYDGITLFFAIAIQTLLLAYTESRRSADRVLRYLFYRSLRICFALTSTIVFLVLLGWPFVDRVLSINFGQLYSSWEVPLKTGVQYYRSFYGWIAIAIAIFGLACGFITNVVNRRVSQFFLIFLIISVAQWLLSVKVLGIHYTLHFTLWIILGLISFAIVIWELTNGVARISIMIVFLLYVLLNFTIGIAPLDSMGNFYASNNSLKNLFSANHPPIKREDYDEIVRLIDYLRRISTPEEPIYVVASSGIITDDLLWHADRTLHENLLARSPSDFWQNKNLNILHWVPFADSKHYYPLELLLQSKFVVIATPFQHHLRPEEHDVIKVVYDAFTNDWVFARDFTVLPERFYLEGGVVVTVYKRTRPTSLKTALLTLDEMKEYVGKRPGGQLSWTNLGEVPAYDITKNADETYDIRTNPKFNSISSDRSLLYLDRRLKKIQLTGQLNNEGNGCSGLSIEISAVTPEAEVIKSKKFFHRPNDGAKFSLSLDNSISGYLLIETRVIDKNVDSRRNCAYKFSKLSVSGT